MFDRTRFGGAILLQMTEYITSFDVMQCHLIEVYGHFRGIYCLQLQGQSVIQASRAEHSTCCFVYYSSTLKMEDEDTFKMSAYSYQTVQCHSP
jgi:hypothetical protein